ncbi:MAG: hypothetical protein E7637_06095 [Ruminococcaceae bacterium]|nr:hypothetical protein [Oscillospiraceae bacterium]
MNNLIDKNQGMATLKSKYNTFEKRMYIFGAITLVLAVIFLIAVPFASAGGEKITFGDVSDLAKLTTLKSSITSALTMHTVLWIVVAIAAVLTAVSFVKRSDGILWVKVQAAAAAGTALFSAIMWIMHLMAATDLVKGGKVAWLWVILFLVALVWAAHTAMVILMSKAMDQLSETAE